MLFAQRPDARYTYLDPATGFEFSAAAGSMAGRP